MYTPYTVLWMHSSYIKHNKNIPPFFPAVIKTVFEPLQHFNKRFNLSRANYAHTFRDSLTANVSWMLTNEPTNNNFYICIPLKSNSNTVRVWHRWGHFLFFLIRCGQTIQGCSHMLTVYACKSCMDNCLKWKFYEYFNRTKSIDSTYEHARHTLRFQGTTWTRETNMSKQNQSKHKFVEICSIQSCWLIFTLE